MLGSLRAKAALKPYEASSNSYFYYLRAIVLRDYVVLYLFFFFYVSSVCIYANTIYLSIHLVCKMSENGEIKCLSMSQRKMGLYKLLVFE